MSVLFLSQIFVNDAHANENSYGARSAGLGGISILLTDEWSVIANQAGLANLNRLAFACSYQNRFMLDELSTKTLIGVLPTKTGTFGLSISQTGFEAYRTTCLGMAFGKKLGAVLTGIRFTYHYLQMSDIDEHLNSVIVEGGLYSPLSKHFVLGVHLYNPYPWRFRNNKEIIETTRFNFGLGLEYVKNGLLAIEVEKQLKNEPILKFGIEYIFKNISFRTGIVASPFVNTIGFGYKTNQLRIDISDGYQQYLGNSPQISIIYIVTSD